jgi:hypothetical protein
MELKHIGRVRTTKKKCLVAYRTLPGDAHYCLIVPTENLPDSYHDSLINLVENPSGQESYEFAEALMRSTFPDGSNMLAALHTQGRLIKVPTSDIEMTPTTSYSITLSELNQVIAEQRGIAVDDLSIKPGISEEAKPVAVPSVAEPVDVTVSQENDTPEIVAKRYRSQADKLAKEAAAFRRLAEELVPTKKK